MIFWIKKIAGIIGITTFFVLFFMGLVQAQEFTFSSITTASIVAVAGASLFWFIGIIIADILLKGVITDIDTDNESLAEGGLLQRVFMFRKRESPDGAATPLKYPIERKNQTPSKGT